MQIVELDVVTDLRNLTYVERPVLSDKVSRDFLPAFKLHYIGLPITCYVIAVKSLIDADTCLMFLFVF